MKEMIEKPKVNFTEGVFYKVPIASTSEFLSNFHL